MKKNKHRKNTSRCGCGSLETKGFVKKEKLPEIKG
jgi:hypothetical protein